MAMIDMIIKQVSPLIGRSPQQIQQALEQAKKMIPQKVNNANEAKQVMKQIGIGNSFLDNISDFVKPIASKFGINNEAVDNYSNQLRSDEAPSNKSQNNSSFNKDKYPRA